MVLPVFINAKYYFLLLKINVGCDTIMQIVNFADALPSRCAAVPGKQNARLGLKAKQDKTNRKQIKTMQFKKICNINDILKIKSYITECRNRFSDMTLASLFMWRKSYPLEYCIENDTLILKDANEDGELSFCYPLGNDPEGALEKAEKYCKERHMPMTLRLMDKETAERIKSSFEVSKLGFERRWSDYLYLAEAMRSFSGRKYNGQRNHLNKFKKLYGEYRYCEITEADIPELISFFDSFEKEQGVKDGIEREEFAAAKELCSVMFSLGLFGGCIRVGERIAAIAIGEIVGDTLFVHVEKALLSFEGAYQVMVMEFAAHHTGGQVIYINREDDSGDEGLRTSKLQYHPIELLDKYYVKAFTLFERISAPVSLHGGRVTLDEIRKEDGERFLRLSSDLNNNKYWGYDYREDEKAEESEEYFLEFVKEMKRTKEEYSLAIRVGDELVGEAVLHGFDFHGGVEIGFRILPEYQGNGYASEAAALLLGYAKDTLGASVVYAKRFKENEASGRCLRKVGFIRTGEDERYIFYEFRNPESKEIG